MKKKENAKWMLLTCAILSGIPFLTSCSSDLDIDLNDVDTTIGLGSDGFTLPNSSTKNSPLSDLLELEDDGVIDTLTHDSASYHTGDYRFQKADSVEAVNPKVKEVRLENPSPTPGKLQIPITASMESLRGQNKNIWFPHAGTDLESPGDPEKVASFTFDGEPNDQIVSLTEADVEGNVTLTIDLQQLAGKVDYATYEIFLPKYLNIDETGFDIVRGTGGLFNDYYILKRSRMSTSSNDVIRLKLKRLTDFANAKDPSWGTDDPYLLFDANGPELNGIVKMRMMLNSNDLRVGSARTTPYDIATGVSLSNNMIITHAQGYFDPDIDMKPQSTDITGVPDFLNDEKVNILLNNPSIKLDIANNIDVEGLADATLVARYKNEQTNTFTYRTLNITSSQKIKMKQAPNGTSVTSTIIVCRKAGTDDAQYIEKRNDSNPLAQTPIAGRTDSVEVYDLAAILNTIPDNIKFILDANANTAKEGSIDLYEEGKERTTDRGCGYEIKPRYSFSAPLELLPGSTIVYNDTIDGWNEDLTDQKIDFYGEESHVLLEADVITNAPLQLVILNPKAIGVADAQGVVSTITSAKVQLTDATGKAINQTTIDKQGKLYLRVSGSLTELDGIIFEVQANASATETLNASRHKVKVDNIKISLNGRITINLD